MSVNDPEHSRQLHPHTSPDDLSGLPEPLPDNQDVPETPPRLPRILAIAFPAVIVLLALAFFGARLWAHHVMKASLPQIDGTLSVPGLSAPVTVQRDAHGVPHIGAASFDDLVVAQAYVTTQDRLWQMDTLRRHATGELAEVLGSNLVAHDRSQRTLQLGPTADRAVASLAPDQLHWLQLYARGVNASIAEQQSHLPLEFRLLRYTPAPWRPRDSILVGLVMFQDLTNTFPTKLSREVISTRLPPALLADLYPVGSWRDHPPSKLPTDLTTPQPEIPNVPLDESQSRLTRPETPPTPPATSAEVAGILKLQQTLNPQFACQSCRAGSNNWALSGAHTASGKPLLSNDMHLSFSVPGIWYESDLAVSSASFHVAGVALPGTPFIIVGHNDHVAWGFTNLGADVQDVYVEHTRPTSTGADFQSPDGTWRPIQRIHEIIHVRRGKDIKLEVLATQHGSATTPIISALLPAPNATNATDRRALSLRWTIYDPGSVSLPFYAINAATDGTALRNAFSLYGGPAQNLVYADDQGHIGYHVVGRIPLRGSVMTPSPLSPVPVSGIDPAYIWAGYIPYDQLPQVLDPPGGILATANARITPDGYPFPITLDWADPYRNERIWRVLSGAHNFNPADSLALETDIYSDPDHAIAQRLAYAIDHADPHTSANPRRLHQAADLLRSWDGRVDANSPAATITDAARTTLWPMLLLPRLGDAWQIYSWGERAYAEEQLIMHNPARWLPGKGDTWDNLLAAAVDKALGAANAPNDLRKWQYGQAHVLDVQHPVFALSPLIPRILGLPTGTGPHPESGDGTTVKQMGHTFGPSERFTADLANPDNTTLNIVLGQSGNPLSPWFLDQFQAWFQGTTFPLPFTTASLDTTHPHTLTLTPR